MKAAVDYMATHSQAEVTGTWHSIPDNGGWNAISQKGADYAAKLGITPGGGSPTVNPNSYAAAGSGMPPEGAVPLGGTSFAGTSTTPPAGPFGGPVQTGSYQGQPYTFQTQPSLGPQGMLDQPNPLVAALAGQGNPAAPPMMSPGVVSMLDLFGGQFGAG